MGGAALVATASAAFLSDALSTGPVLCLFRAVTGIPCPGCGLTRAIARLARGDLARAFTLHPLAPLLAAEAAAAWGLWGLVLAGWVRKPAERPLLALLWVNLAALAVVWGLRLLSGTLPR